MSDSMKCSIHNWPGYGVCPSCMAEAEAHRQQVDLDDLMEMERNRDHWYRRAHAAQQEVDKLREQLVRVTRERDELRMRIQSMDLGDADL